MDGQIIRISCTLKQFKFEGSKHYVDEIRFAIKSGILRDKTIDNKLKYLTNNNKQNDPSYRLEL